MLKLGLKEWHMQHTRNIDGKITTVKNQISVLNSKAELSALLDEELVEVHDLSMHLHSLARVQNSINWQNSRLNWLKDGDANSKNFHGAMSGRRHHNSINMVSVDGLMVEGVHNVRSAVFHHFSTHFKSLGAVRPNIGGLQFRKLFSQDEVKQAIWDCDSYKSPGPDGISFGFIKEFWELLKDDFIRFMLEFHRNGKLTKGINSTLSL
jgi:hypothetical protein